MLRGAIKHSALEASSLTTYVAKASKDASYPITVDLLNQTIFRATLYLEPSNARFTSNADYRNAEVTNFAEVSKLLIRETQIANWVSNVKGTTLSNDQLKARRIWHKGAVLTWGPYLRSILYYALHIMTNDQREKMLYRPPISEPQKEVIQHCLNRLFSHPMWDDPEPEIDSLLVSARKQDELFCRKGLTESYVLHGTA